MTRSPVAQTPDPTRPAAGPETPARRTDRLRAALLDASVRGHLNRACAIAIALGVGLAGVGLLGQAWVAGRARSIAAEAGHELVTASRAKHALRDIEVFVFESTTGRPPDPAGFSALADRLEAELGHLTVLDDPTERSLAMVAAEAWARMEPIAQQVVSGGRHPGGLVRPGGSRSAGGLPGPGGRSMDVLPVRAEGAAVLRSLQQLTEASSSESAAALAELERVRRFLQLSQAAVLAFALVVARLLVRRLHRRIAVPLQELERGAARISGRDFDYRLTPGPVREIRQVAVAFNAMVERLERSQGALRHQAFHDRLTGLPNEAALRRHLAAVDQHGTGVALLVVDLDGFGATNERLGHSTGDRVLCIAADRLRRATRSRDVVARIGDHTFAVLVAPGPGEVDAPRLADRVVDALAPPVSLDGRPVRMAASAGLAVGPPGGDFDDLWRAAELARDEARRSGGGRWYRFEPELLERRLRRLALLDDLQAALDRDELVVHYQPVVDLATEALTGVEALVRWQHPTRGLVPPSEFVPLAEEGGLIAALGERVLSVACRQVRRWQQEVPGCEALTVSVNVSPLQLGAGDFVATVGRTLVETALSAGSLVLEVTESAMADEHAIGQVRRLEALGVGLALDDFGTGFSSLSLLERLPINVLKLDKSFVDELELSARMATVVRSVVRLSWALGIRTVAEGVETEAQVRLLRHVGCSAAQGYVFARPQPAHLMGALLRRGGARPMTRGAGPTSSPASHRRGGRQVVTLEIGPVPSLSALAWLDHVEAGLSAVRQRAPHGTVDEAAVDAVGHLLRSWRSRCGGPLFHWRSVHARTDVADLVQGWLEVAGAVDRWVPELSSTRAPAASRQFHALIAEAVLGALTTESHALDALADELFRRTRPAVGGDELHLTGA